MPTSTPSADPTLVDGTARRSQRVLVIEPDGASRERLVQALVGGGYPTAAAATGEEGLAEAVESAPDLVVLGPTLPDLLPGRLLPRLRAVVPGVAAVVVSCTADEADLVAMLDAGVDDCCVRPESPALLLARIRAVLRRVRTDAPRAVIELGGLSIDLAGRHATLDGEPMRLSPREFDLLAYLAQRAGQVVSKQELLAEVWQLPYSIADKTIDVHVSWLRRKLNDHARYPRFLHTVRGAGLRLDAPAVGRPVTDPRSGPVADPGQQ